MSKLRTDRLDAWVAFLRAHAHVTAKLERELQAERGLPLAWYEVLLYLREAPEGLRMQELARSVMLSKSGLSRLVDRMEAAGLVARRECPSDRRGMLVTTTDAGRSTFRRAAPVHLRGVERHFMSRLTEDDLEGLLAALEKVLAGADESAGAGGCEPDGSSGGGVPQG